MELFAFNNNGVLDVLLLPVVVFDTVDVLLFSIVFITSLLLSISFLIFLLKILSIIDLKNFLIASNILNIFSQILDNPDLTLLTTPLKSSELVAIVSFIASFNLIFSNSIEDIL